MKLLLAVTFAFLAMSCVAYADFRTQVLGARTKDGGFVQFQGLRSESECMINVVLTDKNGQQLLDGLIPCKEFEKLLRLARGEKEI